MGQLRLEMLMHRFRVGGAILAFALAICAPAGALGPALTTSLADLNRAVRCPPAFSGSHEPVLFVHGTAGTAEDHWAIGYAKILPDLGFDVCTVRLPQLALGDIQIAAEYVVHAVRAIAKRSGKRVDVVGYSQGGLESRWAIKYWGDLQLAIDDVVTLASPHHGAYSPDALCAVGSCHPALWQMRTGSSFISVLNSWDETPGPIDYTSIYSLDDELVQPALVTPTAALAGGTNIVIQDVCAWRAVSHGSEPFDAVVYALALDALTHPGPGNPVRALAEHPGLCTRLFTPGLAPDDGAIAHEVVYGNGLDSIGQYPGQTTAEPALAAYVPEASFGAGLAAGIAALALLGRVRARRRTALSGLLGAAALGLPLASAPASAEGPALTTPVEALDRAIQCPIGFSGEHEPILFVHGPARRPEDHWALAYQRILPELGFDVCTVRLPDFAFDDIQTSVEYVVQAVRTIAAASGKRVDVVGYSQGGLEPRWAGKYGPDVHAAIDDLVTLAPRHYASLDAVGETPGEIDYTSLFNVRDELVQPSVATASLDARTAITIQDVCPGRLVAPGALPVDAVTYALVMDALTHDGSGDANRVLAEQPDLCAQVYMPGFTPVDGATLQEVVHGNDAETRAEDPDAWAERPLTRYAVGVTLAAAAGLLLLVFVRVRSARKRAERRRRSHRSRRRRTALTGTS